MNILLTMHQSPGKPVTLMGMEALIEKRCKIIKDDNDSVMKQALRVYNALLEMKGEDVDERN